MKRALLLALLVASSSGCTRRCKGGTFFLTIQLDAMSASKANDIEVAATVDGGGDALSKHFGWPGGTSGTVEIDFPSGYPSGQKVFLQVTTFNGAVRLASQVETVVADGGGCTAFAFVFSGQSDGGMCDPAVDSHCSSDGKSVLTCRVDGSGFDTTQCGSGCVALSGPPRCANIEPTGAATATDYTTATDSVMLTTDTTFDSESGAISGGYTRAASGDGGVSGVSFRLASQSGSTLRLAVFGFKSLSQAASSTIHFTGKNPVAFVVAGDTSLLGTIDVTGDCTAGAQAGSQAGGVPTVNNGDGLGARGGRAGGSGAGTAGGGGGGGFGDSGGRGGNGSGAGGGAAGGGFGDLSTEPVVLIGGSGGGVGGNNGGNGGRGGGTLLVSANGALVIGGQILAGGCGGKGAPAQTGGGGGGSGGALVLEGATLEIMTATILTVNGGGGGGADSGSDGSNGPAAASTAPGGPPGGSGTSGGSGGGAGRVSGAQGGDGNVFGGGGGGAGGRIAVKTLSGMIKDDGAIFSPTQGDVGSSGVVVTLGRASFQ